jgi:hypothetical protein
LKKEGTFTILSRLHCPKAISTLQISTTTYWNLSLHTLFQSGAGKLSVLNFKFLWKKFSFSQLKLSTAETVID